MRRSSAYIFYRGKSKGCEGAQTRPSVFRKKWVSAGDLGRLVRVYDAGREGVVQRLGSQRTGRRRQDASWRLLLELVASFMYAMVPCRAYAVYVVVACHERVGLSVSASHNRTPDRSSLGCKLYRFHTYMSCQQAFCSDQIGFYIKSSRHRCRLENGGINIVRSLVCLPRCLPFVSVVLFSSSFHCETVNSMIPLAAPSTPRHPSFVQGEGRTGGGVSATPFVW